VQTYTNTPGRGGIDGRDRVGLCPATFREAAEKRFWIFSRPRQNPFIKPFSPIVKTIAVNVSRADHHQL